MRLSVEKSQLERALTIAASPIKRSRIPALECVGIEAKDNSLSFWGTDGDLRFRATCEAAVSEVGRTYVNAADLKALVGACGDVVSLSRDNMLRVTSDPVSAALPLGDQTMDPPEKPEGISEIEGAVDAMKLAAPFTDRGGHVTDRMGITFSHGQAFAYNGVALIHSPISGDTDGQCVPAKAITLIARLDGRFFLAENAWRVEGEGFAAQGPLISLRSNLDWRITQKPGEPFAICEADALSGAIQSATLGRSRDVLIEASEGLSVSGKRFEGRPVETSIDVSGDGFGGSGVFASAEMVRALSPFKGSVVSINSIGSGVVISRQPEDGVRVAIAPLRDPMTNLPEPKAAA